MESQFTFEDDRKRLQTLTANIKGAEATIKQVKKDAEEEVKPYREQLKAWEAEQTDVRQRLTIQSLAIYETQKIKTFGGVQLRESQDIVVLDEDQAIQDLLNTFVGDTPIVKVTYSIDKKVLAEWIKARQKLGLDIPPSISASLKYTAALVE